MPFTKVNFRPGINKELTIYANEGGWVLGDKVRFRTGYPEKLGGWSNYSPGNTFKGVCRTLFNWVTYTNENLCSVGTNQLYYIENGGFYNDITPIDHTSNFSNQYTTTNGSNLVQVTDPNHGTLQGSFIIVNGSAHVGGLTISGPYEVISVQDSNNYFILNTGTATSSVNGGGTTTTISYKIIAGSAIFTISGTGWGVPEWGFGGWGGGANAAISGIPLRLWSQANFNQDLVFAAHNSAIYYWTKDTVNYTPAVTINQQASTVTKGKTLLVAPFNVGATSISVANPVLIDIGATITGTGIAPGTIVPVGYSGGIIVPLSLPTIGPSDTNNYTFSFSGKTAPNQTFQIVRSDTFGFFIALGSTPYDPSNFNPAFNPMLVRWTDQANALEWTPTTLNQSGEEALSNGSYIIGGVNTRQELLIWTNTSLYSMQYIGAPFVFGFTLMMDNISCISPNSMIVVSGVTYWMGVDKFYVYSGTVTTLPCTLRKSIFTNINLTQGYQVVTGVNEAFNEIWWFYPSLNSQVNDSYVIFNYIENTWYNGTINRSAWLGSPLRAHPMGVFSIQQSYLVAAMGSTDITLTVINGTSYPASGTLLIDNEYMSYASISGNTFIGVTRGLFNSVITSHLIYASVQFIAPNQIIFHESNVDDLTYPPALGPFAINSLLETADFDIGDGDHYVMVSQVLPDFDFAGSTTQAPQILLTMMPRQNSGTPYQPGVDQPPVNSSSTFPIELFTGMVYTRVRGRQVSFRIDSPNLGVFWQLGAMRFNIRLDGKR